MRRISIRKAAANKAKLSKSIQTLQQKVHHQLFELLETRTLFTVLPAPTVSSNIIGSPGGNDISPSIAVDLDEPNKLVAVWSNGNSTIRGAFSTDGGNSWITLPGLPTNTNQLLRDPAVQT